MLIYTILVVLYLFECLRCELVLMDLNHKLGRFTDKKFSNWWCLAWPYIYLWVSYRKKKWWKDLTKFLKYNKPV